MVCQKGHILKLLLVGAEGTVMSHGPIAVGGAGPETERRIRREGEEVGMEGSTSSERRFNRWLRMSRSDSQAWLVWESEVSAEGG